MYVDDYGLTALVLCVFHDVTRDQAFKILERKPHKYCKLTDNDLSDMLRMKSKGMTYRAIGEVYGLSDQAAYRQMKIFKDRVV